MACVGQARVDPQSWFRMWWEVAKFLIGSPGEWHVEVGEAEVMGFCMGDPPPLEVVMRVVLGKVTVWGEVILRSVTQFNRWCKRPKFEECCAYCQVWQISGDNPSDRHQ